MKNTGILIESDVIADFILANAGSTNSESKNAENYVLSLALQKHLCYTSFIQISEILAVSNDESYSRMAMSVLSMLRPLGAHPRYSTSIAELLVRAADLDGEIRWRMAISASISRVAKLPVLTVRYESVYSRLDIPTIKPDSLRY